MHMHNQGGVGGDEWDAFRLWQDSAKLGLVNAISGLGNWYSRQHKMANGTFMAVNQTLALHWTERAAAAGDRGARHELGTAFLNGHKFNVKQDFYKACKYLAEAAMVNHPFSLFELGVALTDQNSWMARLGRLLDTNDFVFGTPEQLEADGIEIVEGLGRLKFLVLRNAWNQEFSLPLGFDCYSGRKLLQQVAQMGPWTHDEISYGTEYYLDGDDALSAYTWDTCALMGVLTCGLNTIFINQLHLASSEEFENKRYARDHTHV